MNKNRLTENKDAAMVVKRVSAIDACE
jgi:hypothetical protein